MKKITEVLQQKRLKLNYEILINLTVAVQIHNGNRFHYKASTHNSKKAIQIKSIKKAASFSRTNVSITVPLFSLLRVEFSFKANYQRGHECLIHSTIDPNTATNLSIDIQPPGVFPVVPMKFTAVTILDMECPVII